MEPVGSSGKIVLTVIALGLILRTGVRQERCQKLMAHWNAKGEWFNKPNEFEPPQCLNCGMENASGNFHPFGMQHQFLPARCPHCANIVSTDELENAHISEGDHDHISICRPHCLHRFVSSLQYTCGDP